MTPRNCKFLAISILFITGCLRPFGDAPTAKGISLIRDTEIERTIRSYAAPILRVAELDEEAFNIHIVQSGDINAFVARGQRLFITTGLLRRSTNANQLIGVIAHEIGHITGGHLARTKIALEKAGTTALITQIMGVAAGILTENMSTASGIIKGGENVVARSFLNYSRGQEQSADQAAVRFLDKAGFSSRGMLDFLKVLSGQELLHSNQQDPYMLTHPLTSGRIAFVRHHVINSRFSNRPTPPNFSIMHRRLVAKLDGYIDAPSKTFRRYSDTDNSVAALYARCLAYFRHGNLKKATILVDELANREPQNPYFFELKGQMMFENGRINKALRSYRKAVRLLPNAPLLRTALAHVELETNRPDLIDDVVKNTEVALRMDPLISMAWRLNGVAHGRKGKMGLSSLSLAEYNLLIGRKAQAAALAKRAMRLLSTGEPAWLRAQDIDNQVNQKGK